MGEEKKKPEGEKKAEDAKPATATAAEPEKKEEKPAAAAEEKPKDGDDKKSEDKNKEKDKKDAAPPPPPPPQEIILRVYMHCEGCARKVRKCLKGFDGVEDVSTDCKTHKVVIKGEKADPVKVVDRVQKKTHRQVELLYAPPKPPAKEEPNKPEEKEHPKPEEKKEEPKVITVVLKVHMHCEACSLEIKKRIEKMKEVESATPDLKNSQVTVKGTFEAAKLVEYVHKRTSKHATIVSQDPPPETKDEDGKGKDGKEEKNGEEGKKAEKKGEGKGDKKDEAGGGGGGGGEGGGGEGDKAATTAEAEAEAAVVEEGPTIVELKRNEFYHYPPRYATEMYAYPPQIFSDENPNACSIM